MTHPDTRHLDPSWWAIRPPAIFALPREVGELWKAEGRPGVVLGHYADAAALLAEAAPDAPPADPICRLTTDRTADNVIPATSICRKPADTADATVGPQMNLFGEAA